MAMNVVYYIYVHRKKSERKIPWYSETNKSRNNDIESNEDEKNKINRKTKTQCFDTQVYKFMHMYVSFTLWFIFFFFDTFLFFLDSKIKWIECHLYFARQLFHLHLFWCLFSVEMIMRIEVPNTISFHITYKHSLSCTCVSSCVRVCSVEHIYTIHSIDSSVSRVNRDLHTHTYTLPHAHHSFCLNAFANILAM